MSQGFSIQIEGPGLSVQADVPERFARWVAGEIMSGDLEALHPELWPEREAGTGPPSLRDYVSRARPGTNTEKLTTVAAWLSDVKREAVLRDEVGSHFDRAGWKAPANPGRDLRKAVEIGLLEEVEPGRSYLPTDQGRRRVGLPSLEGGEGNRE